MANVTAEQVRDALVALEEKKRAYQLTFSGPGAALVLEDLARFCRADRSAFHLDARLHALLEGRRETYLRIKEWLDLTPEELLARKAADITVITETPNAV